MSTYIRTNVKTKGFTLIELLVVIAIIGVLASVVLASLNTARAKGADAAIKSNINSARTQAELYYDNQTPRAYQTGAGVSMCPTGGALPSTLFTGGDPTIMNAMNSILGQGVLPVCATTPATGVAYRIYSPLRVTGAGNYCVDSTGKAYSGTTALPAFPNCP